MIVVDAGVVAIGWMLGFALLWRLPRLGEPGSRGALPSTEPDGAPVDHSLSVVIPARNEEGSLPTLLASLAAQTTRPGEILVIDDHSTDDTASIAAADPQVTLVSAPPLPEGWCGKNWACWTGARRSTGSRLVFLDADVELAPTAIAELMDTHDASGGLLSVQPHHVVHRPYEWASMVFNLMAVMALGIASVHPTKRPRGAFGPCIVVHRRTYDALDGHRGVAAEVVEDMALGARFADTGQPVTLLGGGSSIQFRMYPDGFRQLLEGWTKNIASGARRTPPVRALLAAVWVTAVFSGLRYPITTLLTGEQVLWAVVVPLAFVVQIAVLSRRVGTFPLVSWLLYPLWFAVFAGVFLASLFSTLVTRQVSWRGRTITLPPHTPASTRPLV